MAHFSNIGGRCAVVSCGQRDFLPFTCELCGKTHCLDHFRPEDHSCPLSGSDNRVVIVCPLCGVSVQILFGESADETWHRHAANGDCQPKSMEAKPTKTRCPVPGCRQALTVLNKFECKVCHTVVCLQHRYGDQHSCVDRAKDFHKARRSNVLSRFKFMRK